MMMDQCRQQCLQGPSRGVFQYFGRLMQVWGKRIERAAVAARDRRQLLDMDDRLLKDIGLSRTDAEQLAGYYRRGRNKSAGKDRLNHYRKD